MADYINNNAGMDWDDAIENRWSGVHHPAGRLTDNFTVTDFERGRFPGSAKMSACNKATLTLQVKTDDGIASVRTDLILNRVVEFRISAFFRCIGQKKHGERLEAEEQAERDVLAEREAALAKQLEEMRGKKRKLVDPLQYALSIAAEDLTNYVPTFAWEMSPPSEKQVAFLERRGIFADSVRNAGLASLLIDRLQRRQQMGLATPKQIRCLERYGFRQVGTWAFEDASSLISMLAGNSWRVPYGITPALYRP